MSFLNGNHLGSLGFLGDDSTGGSADPNTPVVNLTTNTDALPTNPPTPLATADATDVPTTPSDPLQFTSPTPLAVVDPNTLLQTPVPAPVVIAPTPTAGANQKAMLIGVGVLGLFLLARSGTFSSSSAPKRSGHSSRHRRSRR